jgi:hypothetical protein
MAGFTIPDGHDSVAGWSFWALATFWIWGVSLRTATAAYWRAARRSARAPRDQSCHVTGASGAYTHQVPVRTEARR